MKGGAACALCHCDHLSAAKELASDVPGIGNNSGSVAVHVRHG